METNIAEILKDIAINIKANKFGIYFLSFSSSQAKKAITKQTSLKKLFFPIVSHCNKTGEVKNIKIIIFEEFLLTININAKNNGMNCEDLINQVVLSWK